MHVLLLCLLYSFSLISLLLLLLLILQEALSKSSIPNYFLWNFVNRWVVGFLTHHFLQNFRAHDFIWFASIVELVEDTARLMRAGGWLCPQMLCWWAFKHNTGTQASQLGALSLCLLFAVSLCMSDQTAGKLIDLWLMGALPHLFHYFSLILTCNPVFPCLFKHHSLLVQT